MVLILWMVHCRKRVYTHTEPIIRTLFIANKENQTLADVHIRRKRVILISFYWLLRDSRYLVQMCMSTDVNIWTSESHLWCLKSPLKGTGDHDQFLVIDFSCFLLAVREIYPWELVLVHMLAFCFDTWLHLSKECDMILSDQLSYRSMAISYSCEKHGKNERCNLPSNIFMLLVHGVYGSFMCDRKDSWALFLLRPYSTYYTYKGIVFT